MSPGKKTSSEGVVASNRRARHDYDIEATYEAGISLVGSEVKSMRGGKASLQDAYGVLRGGEIFLHGMHVPEYPQASMLNHEPTRIRKLLLHASEIAKIKAKIEQKGYTLVPLKVYFKGNKIKVELALARGRKQHDKRRAISEREAKREIERASGTRRG